MRVTGPSAARIVGLLGILAALVGCEEDGDLVSVVRTDAARPDLVADVPDAADAADMGTDLPEAPDAPVSEVGSDLPGDAGALDTPDARGPDGSSTDAGDASPDTGPEPGPDMGSEAGTLACTGPDCPPAQQNLQVWLSGDWGRDCVAAADGLQRVRLWKDRSPHGRDAHPAEGKLGPACGTSEQAIAGRDVVFFPATAGMQGQEHLEVDLSALIGKGFTIAVVEKRAGPRGSSYMIGSRLKNPEAVTCGRNVNAGRGLLLGYPMAISLRASTWGPDCDVNAMLTPTLEKPSLVVMTFTPPSTISLHVNGTKAGESQGSGLASLEMGLIGRGYEMSMAAKDGRYYGSIGEIAVYDVALDDSQRAGLESYLNNKWQTGP
jgi:hypothetical protein